MQQNLKATGQINQFSVTHTRPIKEPMTPVGIRKKKLSCSHRKLICNCSTACTLLYWSKFT